MNWRRHVVIAASTGFLTLTGGLIALAANPAADDKQAPRPDPWAHLTDAQKHQTVEAAHARGLAWQQDFVRQGQSLRSLPRERLPDYAAASGDPEAALRGADLIVRAAVTSTTFTFREDGALPLAQVSVTVKDGGQARDLAGKTLEITQVGGPTLVLGAGALLELESGSLLLPGDDVILALVREPGSPNSFRTVPNHGVIYVDGDVIAAHQPSEALAAYAGKDATATLRAFTR